jgi:Flp pilus assembly pilin Flp
MRRIKELFSDELGQDLIEYTLMLAIISLASAALFMSAGGDVSRIWTAANSQLTNSGSSGSSGGGPDCSHDHGDHVDCQ